MKAITYHKKSQYGIKMSSIPRPTMKCGPSFPVSMNTPKRIILSFMLRVLQYFYSVLLVLLHPIVTIPAAQHNNAPLVLVKVRAVSINPVDAKFLYGDKVPRILLPIVQWVLEHHVCGIDFSGTVEGIASPSTDATDIPIYIGEEVFGTAPPAWGSLAEYIIVPMHQLTIKPKDVSHLQAAALPLVSLTAMQSMCAVLPEHRVLIIGASGGPGHIAAQYAIHKGAKVTCICSLKNMEFVRTLNPFCVIAYDGDDVMTALHHHVDHNGPYDFVYDTVTSNETCDAEWNYYDKITSSPSLLYHGSKYTVLGGSPAEWVKAHFLRFFGINMFPRGKMLHWVRFSHSAEELEEIARFVAQDTLKAHIDKVVPFTEEGVRDAFEAVKSRRTVGKIVVEFPAS